MLPPELLNNDPAGFAWGVWHDRTPKLIARIRDGHPYDPQQRDAFDALLAEVETGVMRALPDDARDKELWVSAYYGKPWLDAPFLWSESYFYRRLLDAARFFEPGPWYYVDPFAQLKAAELSGATAEAALAAQHDLDGLTLAEQGQAKLLAAVWGNQADLTFRIGRAGAATGEAGLVADQSGDVWAALAAATAVVLVTDNAGLELLADLILVDHILAAQPACSVWLHVKPLPFFVSDATTADVTAGLDRLGRTQATAGAAARIRDAATRGRFTLYTHEFYCSPRPYQRMPAGLAAQFAAASLTIMKGDLNYRRLTGDRAWPPDTPFADVVGYFPGRLAALRTLKSDVLTGVSPEVTAGLGGADGPWRTNGSHGLIQVLAGR
ncbi:MAG TPA: ARMT1-like domain-containing protein [Streptosporangiaceae bacterium]|jgi:hypothetical protein